MKLDAWVFSMKQAWQQPFLRIGGIIILGLFLLGTAFFVWRSIDERAHGAPMVFHYTIYLGIDDVRSWRWAFVFPAVWGLFAAADLMLAYGLYRSEPQLSYALTAIGVGWSILWLIFLYHVTLVNV